MCVSVEVRGQPQVSFRRQPTLFFETGFLTGTQNLTLSSTELLVALTCLCLPPWEHRRSHHCARPLMWALRIMLSLCSKHLADWALLQSPIGSLALSGFHTHFTIYCLEMPRTVLPRFTCCIYKFGQILLSLNPLNILRLLDPKNQATFFCLGRPGTQKTISLGIDSVQ